MLEALTPQTKLIFICSPGNPTSKAIPVSDIERIAQSSYKGIIVIDEGMISATRFKYSRFVFFIFSSNLKSH